MTDYIFRLSKGDFFSIKLAFEVVVPEGTNLCLKTPVSFLCRNGGYYAYSIPANALPQNIIVELNGQILEVEKYKMTKDICDYEGSIQYEILSL